MAYEYPYIEVRARTVNDSTATVTIRIEEEFYGVDQQAIVDGVKAALSNRDDITSLTATKYEMAVTNTDM
ncbi:hypothetical protein [Streptomyces sp. NRRL S-813]|uniref:hypothetical protein n=1 Tax=Streptomyces sp. NRRL S-813 TaxID=1463919 RepID=UPI0004C0AD87|nr:hypothetical protein [Streptomyces sp. NRRL S-813]